MKNIILLFLICLCQLIIGQESKSISYEIEIPELIIEGLEYDLKIQASEKPLKTQVLRINQEAIAEFHFDAEGEKSIPFEFDECGIYTFEIGDQLITKEIAPIPIWLSIIPPLIAILLALFFKEVVSALLLGILSGAFIIQFYIKGFWGGLLFAFTSSIDHYIMESIADSGHISIILFSLLIGGMVSVISKNGGMQGIVNRISAYASNAKNGQLATWFLGIAIFFDDYANTLIVGNTMRPVTDRLKISREKLAYLVDSTAAPIAAIAFITTWIGAELGYIESGISNLEGINESVYSIFISSLAYSFYPIFALIFMFILIMRQRDFGPMYRAEMKARNSEQIEEDSESNLEITEFNALENIKHRSFNAIIPVLVVIIGTIVGLLYTGYDDAIWSDQSMSWSRKLSSTIGNADSYLALLWSSLAGLFIAILLTISQGIMKLEKTIETAIRGFKTMLPAIIILILAWSLALVIEELHTADLLTSLLSDNISPYFAPAITFILAAVVAFSTGSSWGTMAILYPLMLPASWAICESTGMDYATSIGIFHNVVASVLAGAVLGDHCSPISDTTILSSLASSCNHINHVRTQLPYALTVGLIAILCGTIPAAYGVPFYVTLPIGIGIIYGTISIFGKKVDAPK